MNDNTNPMLESLVTIVIVPRERFGHTGRSLESLYANTPLPFRLIYVDGNSPAAVKYYLKTQAREKGFRLLRTEHYLSPNQARNMGLRRADSKYVVFLDNDVEVAPGWLEALVQCAEETDASVVGPLYCIGQPLHQLIHMAGGEASIREVQGRRRLHEKHRFCNKRVIDVCQQIRREPCELVEFHCVLVRRQVFRELGVLDEALLSSREHIDLCLTVRQAGGTVWFEPNAVVTYLPAPPFAWSDIPYYLLRWSDRWAESTLRHFDRKWNLDQSNAQLVGTWLRPHRQLAFGPLRALLCRITGRRLGTRLVDGLEWFMSRQALRKAPHPRSEAPSDGLHALPVEMPFADSQHVLRVSLPTPK
jgi:GT2 family glycosyltransferase